MTLHKCIEADCCYTDQPSPRGCGCHQTDEQVLRGLNAALLGLVHQYRNDLLYPPSADSRERRIAAIDHVLSDVSRAVGKDGGQ